MSYLISFSMSFIAAFISSLGQLFFNNIDESSVKLYPFSMFSLMYAFKISLFSLNASSWSFALIFLLRISLIFFAVKISNR